MALISVKNLTFSYEGSFKNVFENVSFQIDTNWRLGVVGRNGRGKTTLFNLFLGKYKYSGTIASNVEFTYFPYPVQNKNRLVREILYEVCPYADDGDILREFSYLGVGAGTLYDIYLKLSEGEQTKILLAGLFLNDGNFLLIDEPTNHLDEAARRTVAEYLKSKNGFVLVSHDRAFLDECIDHVLSINRNDIEIKNGNFSNWFSDFDKRQQAEAAQNEKLKKDIEKLADSARRTANWADKTEASKYGKASSGLKQDKGFVGHKAAKLMKRAKITEGRKFAAIENKSKLLKNAETAEDLKLNPLKSRAEKLAEFSNVKIFYDGKSVCSPFSFEICSGERVAIDGKNGCGKSSILKITAGEAIEFSGIVYKPSGLKISYVPQNPAPYSGNIAGFAKENGVDERLLMSVLDKMGFEYVYGENLCKLSSGQIKKLYIAKSLCESANLYIWDEPLNYLDIYARVQLENLILKFKPSMLFVEHDQAFKKAIATKIQKI